MEYFETIIKALLEHEGYWVRQSFKVNLTKKEKERTGRPTIPRPEIDLIAFKPDLQELLALETKSFFDSAGVKIKDLQKEFKKSEGRYKLFTCKNYRDIVFNRLKKDLKSMGMIKGKVTVRLGLVAGNIYQNQSEEIRKYLKSKKWFFWAPEDIRGKVIALAAKGYENEPVIITAKILTRKPHNKIIQPVS